MSLNNDTIVASATATGGAIAIVRLSGEKAIDICDNIFVSPSGKRLSTQKGYSLLYGNIVNNEGGVLDDVLLSLFRAPASYTGENMVEISCHGSSYIVSEIIKLLISNGARSAEPGEFTTRAFLAGKLDLSQAEAVADMISSEGRASHAMASMQIRGGYSDELHKIREELLKIVSLIELELDFSEEDVTFADRSELDKLLNEATSRMRTLLSSFSLGNAIKEGIGVAIVGSPNAGKSTLLNTLLRDNRAMVSSIAGTTRDVIEESINIEGVKFRLIDTAGIRKSDDVLEQMGIERTYDALSKASIILYMIDASKLLISLDNRGNSIDNQNITSSVVEHIRSEISNIALNDNQHLIIVLNKCDVTGLNNSLQCSVIQQTTNQISSQLGGRVIAISAKHSYNISLLTGELLSCIDTESLFNGETIVSNTRHYEALIKSEEALQQAILNLRNDISSELLSQNIRESLYWLGTITGEITTDEILQEIFSKFCIGK